MTETADNALEEQQLPEDQAPSSPETPSPETVAAEREREIQRHLSQQGRELADARRRADAAQAVASAQAAQIGNLEANIRLLSEHLNEQQRQQAQARQAQIDAELASLPPEDRLERKIGMLQDEIREIRTAAPQAQPAQPTPPQPPQPQQQGAGQQTQAEDPADYMTRRVREIQQEAQDEFGVLVTTDEVPDDAWNSEDAFYKSVMKAAATKSRNGGDMPSKPKAETQEQLRDRIRQEERERLGVNSPAAPRAQPAGRKKSPTGDDVRSSVQTYNSSLGPKANVQKLKELRDSMNT
jgi:hypothetical protein